MSGGDKMEDERIITLYWERDENAIRETELKYGNYCHTIAYNILHSHEDSDECVNDTLSSAWDTIPPEKPNNLRCFLSRLTRNIALDRYRYDNAKKRAAVLDVCIDEYAECMPSKEASIEDETMLKDAVNSFLSSLDAKTRIIFMRRYWYSMSLRDIARGMRLSENHVGVILHRTRNKFKNHLTKEGILI